MATPIYACPRNIYESSHCLIQAHEQRVITSTALDESSKTIVNNIEKKKEKKKRTRRSGWESNPG